MGVRVFLVTQPVDLRGSFYSLSAHVRGVLGEDPQQGQLFVFLGKTGHLIKILFWDRSGYCIFAKRLERARFELPADLPPDTLRHEVDFATLTLLLEGIDLAGARRRPAYTPPTFSRDPENP